MKVLPFHSDLPHYEFNCQLDAVTFTFIVRWNATSAGWYVSLLTADGEELCSGVRITCGMPLFGRYKNDAMPAGNLIAVNFTQPETDPGYGDLGSSVLVMYLATGESLT